jgi:hypothetical protein
MHCADTALCGTMPTSSGQPFAPEISMPDLGSLFFALPRSLPRAALAVLAAALVFGPMSAGAARADGNDHARAAIGIATAIIIGSVIVEALEDGRDWHGGQGYDWHRVPEGSWARRRPARLEWRDDGPRSHAARDVGRRSHVARDHDGGRDAQLGAYRGHGWRAVRTGGPWAVEARRLRANAR